MLPAQRKQLTLIFILLLAGLGLSLWWARTYRPDLATVLAPDTYTEHREVKWPHRGRVFDRHDSLLVFTGRRYLLVLPSHKWLDSAHLNRLLGWPDSAFELRTRELCRRALPAQLDLTAAEADTLRRHRRAWPALVVREYTARNYAVPVAAPVLGFAHDNAQPFLYQAQRLARGRFYRLRNGGIESYYNGLLAGRRGACHPLRDALNHPHGTWAADTAYQPGQDLHLSLDTELQAYAERILGERRGYIVALEPATGEILCYVSAPTFAPATLTGLGRGRERRELLLSPDMPLLNRPALLANPPGSVFKLVNAAVALQLGAITPQTGFRCDQSLINCVHEHPNAHNLTQAFKYSCNPYFYQVLRAAVVRGQSPNKFEDARLGLGQWQKMVKSFGLGEKLGVDMSQEKRGLIPSPDFYDKLRGYHHWNFKTVYSLSIGQGEIGITGLQMANVLATIANRGWYYTPHFVRGIGNGGPLPEFQQKHYTAVDTTLFKYIIPGMQMVVDGNGGTGNLASLSQYGISVAGKTGTVQNPHGYDHATFAAFAPANDPKIAIAVFIENSGFGGTSAAPAAGLMIEKYLRGKVAPYRHRMEDWVMYGDFTKHLHGM